MHHVLPKQNAGNAMWPCLGTMQRIQTVSIKKMLTVCISPLIPNPKLIV